MSGECEVCGNHCLECICNQTLESLRNIMFPKEPTFIPLEPIMSTIERNLFLSLCARGASDEEFAHHGWTKVLVKPDSSLKESY